MAAIILEPVQGEGGYIVPPKEFLFAYEKFADKYGIQLILMKCKRASAELENCLHHRILRLNLIFVQLRKGIASGLPLSAILAKKSLMTQWAPGAHGGTFGGNPVACAAALATLDVLEGGAIDNAAIQGDYAKQKHY